MYLQTIRDTVFGYYKLFQAFVRIVLPRVQKERSTQRHLMILAWAFPPTISGGVYRPLSIARVAAEDGWQVTVISGPMPDVVSDAGKYLIDLLPSSVRVLRVNNCIRQPSYRFFPRIDGGFLSAISTIERCREPDVLVPSVILSSGPPFHNFIVGWYMSHFFNRPLILDYRDEWGDCPFDFVHTGNMDRFLEQRCLLRASSVLYTTESFQAQAHQSFPKINVEKFHVVPNGYDKGDLAVAPLVNMTATMTDTLRIAFLGTLSGHSDPFGFLNTLAKFLELHNNYRTKIKVIFIGHRHREIDRLLKEHVLHDIIQTVDHVPKPTAITLMRDSDVLLSLNPIELHRYIPGKLFDYIASGTPVIVYGNGGEVGKIVESLGVGVVVPESDPVALGKAFDKIGNFITLGAVDESSRNRWLSMHERGYIATNLMRHLTFIDKNFNI